MIRGYVYEAAGDYQSVNRSDYPPLLSPNLDACSGRITLELLNRAIAKMQPILKVYTKAEEKKLAKEAKYITKVELLKKIDELQTLIGDKNQELEQMRASNQANINTIQQLEAKHREAQGKGERWPREAEKLEQRLTEIAQLTRDETSARYKKQISDKEDINHLLEIDLVRKQAVNDELRWVIKVLAGKDNAKA